MQHINILASIAREILKAIVNKPSASRDCSNSYTKGPVTIHIAFDHVAKKLKFDNKVYNSYRRELSKAISTVRICIAISISILYIVMATVLRLLIFFDFV